ncbi:sensor histidine kinase [Frigidibacter sp. ROC022]|uniref:sensor histidine kinase n=1 Tax=Frigidibacter sp. ROC022 TaxID=2971796 RepID=UPI00215A93A0|nr:sensor histidine kinase [Frigidibacter sp. ROC022]MCR8726511.1 sensor histidine kinase [Frigidibacter sp. ROC022]
MRDSRNTRDAEVVLGEDWIGPQGAADREARAQQAPRRWMAFNSSPLARKIVTFNLLALVVLVAGVLFLNPFRDSLVTQHERGLIGQAELLANIFEVQMPAGAPVSLRASNGPDVAATLKTIDIDPTLQVYLFDSAGKLIATTEGMERNAAPPIEGLERDESSTVITDFLNGIWVRISGLLNVGPSEAPAADAGEILRGLVPAALTGVTQVGENVVSAEGTIFSVAAPVMHNGVAVGVVALSSGAGDIDHLVRLEREQVLQMFVIAILVSIGLSLVLASTIANPLADLAAAAEIGRDRNKRTVNPGRVRIPDLSGRPDEIGRLSGALRGMVTALYDRIDANEQFAADVAHEIKNPLASLRSAVVTLRVAKRDDQREKLLDVIEHDTRRLDRLVSDISNASRLDSELVKEEEQPFNLLKMLGNLSEYLGAEARGKGVEFISDLPPEPIVIHGLEARLAQVFVNLITNAISFCDEGDAIRVWARRRENRVLVVVEDTGPGIPEGALSKVFKRFYSDRPVDHFGNNSGLGLAISKQIVEAHGGVIWAENIRPTDADVTSDPLGARFVVGLPV